MATALYSVVDDSKYVQLDECLVTLADLELIGKEKFPDCADHQILLQRPWHVTDRHKFFLLKEEDTCITTKVLATVRCVVSSRITLHAVKTKAKCIPGYDFKKIYLKFSRDGCVELNMPVFD